jgi:hypothetical protein
MRLPGMRSVEGPWIVVDEAFAAQMAEKDRLLRERRAEVLAFLDGSEAARSEALEVVLEGLPAGFAPSGAGVRRPDGITVRPGGEPLEAIGRLVQEDVLLCEPRGGAHMLTAGLLCFPASWTLREKLGRPLARIHAPVRTYDATLARRVERLFARVRPGRPIWRANALAHADPALFQPRREADPREPVENAAFLRSERQTVLRLPRTGAILFAVHTYVVRADDIGPEQREGCRLPLAR